MRHRKFSQKVYSLVKKIPSGKVATYGQIATSLRKPEAARAVGNALHYNPFNEVPCHRVVNQEGRVAEHFGKGGWKEQRNLLLKEGIKFIKSRKVDLKKHQFRNF